MLTWPLSPFLHHTPQLMPNYGCGPQGPPMRAKASSGHSAPPPKEGLTLCHPLSPPRHQGSHMQYLFLSEGSCFNSEKPGPPLSRSPSLQLPPPSFALAAAAQVITRPRETRPGLCFLHKAADMFPTVNTFPTEDLKGLFSAFGNNFRQITG